MDRRKFRYYQAALGAFVGAMIGWSVVMGDITLAAFAIIIGLAGDYLCRKSVTEVVEDEMILRFSERASRRALQVYLIVGGIAGVVLITLRSLLYTQLVEIGYALAFSACSLLILYLFFYLYYSRRGLE